MENEIRKFLRKTIDNQREEQPGTSSHAFLSGKIRAYEEILDLSEETEAPTHDEILDLLYNCGTVAACNLVNFDFKDRLSILHTKLVELTNICEEKGGKGQEWIVTSPEIASMFGFSAKESAYLICLGKIDDRWNVYTDSSIAKDILIIGKGKYDGVSASNIARIKFYLPE